jgi:hypothetical protein
MPTPMATTSVTPAESDEDPGFAEINDDDELEESEVLDDAA